MYPIIAIVIFLALIVYFKRNNMGLESQERIESISNALQEVISHNNLALPSMFIDMNQLEKNIEIVKQLGIESGKTIRLATKSVRVPEIIKLILTQGHPIIKGIMCYNVEEAQFLNSQFGIDDILVAYPTLQRGSGRKGSNNNSKSLSKANSKLQLCIDVDMSYRLFGGMIHLGCQRSACRSVADFQQLIEAIQRSEYFTLSSVMGYEAQLSVPDQKPNHFFNNIIMRLFKELSFSDVLRKSIYSKRREIYQFLKSRNIELKYFNGGGSATALRTIKDSCVNEITVGSALFQSHLFDYFSPRIGTSCALIFALPITRNPQKGVYTSQSGGFICSGPLTEFSTPTFLDGSLQSFSSEGFGEELIEIVQTPIRSEKKLNLGQAVLLRPAKAGEIAEQFNHYWPIYIRKDSAELKDACLTYRGYGNRFF